MPMTFDQIVEEARRQPTGQDVEDETA